MSKKGLGRGLSALLGDDARHDKELAETLEEGGRAPASGLQTLSIELLIANPDQPRRHFNETALTELADSIREKGILQPILVRPIESDPGLYEIVAGERRWRAAQKAQLHQIPVVVRTLSDKEAMEIALIENIQRQDLSPIEEAVTYHRLIEELGHTQEALGQAVGKSRSHVANMLRLLTLPEKVQDLVDHGKLSMGHARALITAKEPAKLAALVMEKGLSVRQTEELAQRTKRESAGGSPVKKNKDPDTRALENDIAQALGLRVNISHKGKGGDLTISYSSLDQLDELCQRLCHYPSGRKEPGVRGF